MSTHLAKSSLITLLIVLATAVGFTLATDSYWKVALHLLVILLTAAGVDSLNTADKRTIDSWIMPILYVGVYQRLLTTVTVLPLWLPLLIIGGILLAYLLHISTAATPPFWALSAYTLLLYAAHIALFMSTLTSAIALGATAGLLFLLLSRLFAPLTDRLSAAVFAITISLVFVPLTAAVFAWPITLFQATLILTLLFYLTAAFFCEQLSGRFQPWRFAQYLIIVFVGLIMVSFIG